MLLSVDAPLMAFHDRVSKDLRFDKRPLRVTHNNDISIHFQTTKERGVIFATSNPRNSDYMKAYLDGGHVYVDTYIHQSGREVHFAIM